MRPYSEKWLNACYRMCGLDFNKNLLQGEVAEWWFNDDARFLQILGGERSGKSRLAAFLALACMDLSKPGEYWIVGPDYRQARPEFQYIYDALNGAGLIDGDPSMPVSEASPWACRTAWGATIKTRSAADEQKLASFSVDGAIEAEAAQSIYEAHLKLMGRVSETNGFLILSGTLEKGLPWYGDLYERWQGQNTLGARSFSLPTWSNLEVYPGGRTDPRILELEAEYPPDLFMERFGAIPSRKYGRVLPEFDIKTHVKHLTYDPKHGPVRLAVDPGQHCYAVLFIQHVGLVTHVLDRVYQHGVIAHDVIPMAMASPYWKHIDPSDAGTIDNAGKQHHANKSQVELWKELAGINLSGQYIPLEDTITTLRYRLGDVNALHQPLVLFNDHMNNTVDPSGLALDVLAEPYHWRWPDRPSGKNTAVRPVDKNNDAMKALGYALVARYGVSSERRKLKVKKRSYW